jgi:hypothetical protein
MKIHHCYDELNVHPISNNQRPSDLGIQYYVGNL